MQCVILAGGLGTRMRPYTEKIPKALIPVDSHPFINYQLQWMKEHGVTDAVLCLGYLGGMIRTYVGDGGRWGLKIRFVDEKDKLRGTGGALRLALDSGVLGPVFFATYGDSFLPVDFQPVWDHFQRRSEPALMTVLKNDEQWDRSNACFDGEKVTLYDKTIAKKPECMRYIDYGLMAFRRTLIESKIPPSGIFDLAGLLHQLSKAGQLAGFEVKKRFYEIGSPQGLADFEGSLSCYFQN